jgi:hypothetical protein
MMKHVLVALASCVSAAHAQTVIRSADGRAQLSIPATAMAPGGDVALVAVRDSSDPSAAVGSSYRIVPSNVHFTRPATLTIAPDTTMLPGGVTLAAMGIARADDESWHALPSIVDGRRGWVSAMVADASTYTVRWQSPSSRCDGALYHALDFRVGTWSYRADDYDPGRTVVTADASGCALYEHYENVKGGRASAFFVHDSRDGKWHSTTLDPGGRTLATGGPAHGRFIMYHSATDREAYVVDATGAILFTGERSGDGGKTWSTWFTAHYAPAR